jgi:hypothetical protein
MQLRQPGNPSRRALQGHVENPERSVKTHLKQEDMISAQFFADLTGF